MCFGLFQICGIECLVSLGTSLLVLVVMPQFDVLTNLFISGGVCIVSAILQIVYRLQGDKWKILFPICSLILTVTGTTIYFTVFLQNFQHASPIIFKLLSLVCTTMKLRTLIGGLPESQGVG